MQFFYQRLYKYAKQKKSHNHFMLSSQHKHLEKMQPLFLCYANPPIEERAAVFQLNFCKKISAFGYTTHPAHFHLPVK